MEDDLQAHKHLADRKLKEMSNQHDHDNDCKDDHYKEGGIMQGYQQPGLMNYMNSFMPNNNTDNRYIKF